MTSQTNRRNSKAKRPLRYTEVAEPKEVIEYRWGRIAGAFGVLAIAISGYIYMVWPGASSSSGEQAIVFVDELSRSDAAMFDPDELPATAAGIESLPTAGAAAPVDVVTSDEVFVPKPLELKSPVASEPKASKKEPVPATQVAMLDNEAPPELASANQEKTSAKVALGRSEANAQAVAILSDRLVRAQLTHQLRDKEPVDKLGRSVAMNDDGIIRVYLFTEMQNLKGETVYHDWYLGDKRMARVRIRPHSDSMRASSSKFINRNMEGHWTVRVTTETGKQLALAEFEVE